MEGIHIDTGKGCTLTRGRNVHLKGKGCTLTKGRDVSLPRKRMYTDTGKSVH